jgi:CRP-like cAMP-binding protein
MEAPVFQEAVYPPRPFRELLARYLQALYNTMAQTAVCNRTHPVTERCARWLLLTHDRVEGDAFQLTHEFLAQMLGVRRASVAVAAGMLQRAGLIRYRRGLVEILDREGLEEACCPSYGIVRDSFEAILGTSTG